MIKTNEINITGKSLRLNTKASSRKIDLVIKTVASVVVPRLTSKEPTLPKNPQRTFSGIPMVVSEESSSSSQDLTTRRIARISTQYIATPPKISKKAEEAIALMLTIRPSQLWVRTKPDFPSKLRGLIPASTEQQTEPQPKPMTQPAPHAPPRPVEPPAIRRKAIVPPQE